MDYKFAIEIAKNNRKVYLHFLESFTLTQLNTVPLGFKNSIVWNIAHTIATQQLLVYNLSGLTMKVHDDFVNRFRKGTKHEVDVTASELSTIKHLLFSTLEDTKTDYERKAFSTYQPYTVSTGSTLKSVEDALSFNNFHEGIHLGYILALKKSL